MKGTTAFENTILYSQSTCSHLRFTHTIRPTQNTADPYDTTTELSPINILIATFRPHTADLHQAGHYPLRDELKFTDRDPHWYSRRVIDAIHIRIHPNNINRDRGFLKRG